MTTYGVRRFERLVELDERELSDPGDVYDALRVDGPIVWVERLKSFVITSYELAAAVLSDHERFRSGIGHPTGPLFHDRDTAGVERVLRESPDLAAELHSEQATLVENKTLLDADPPLHT